MKFAVRTSHIIISLLLLVPCASFSEGQMGHDKRVSSGVETLSPALRELLSKEMLAIQEGMKTIIPAYAAGQWHEIEHIANKIKNSYILKQKLSEKQRHELHDALPESFITLDQQFHYLAGMLEHVAAEEKPELVGFYFSRLSDSCIACHSAHATHKFPALASENHDGHDH